MKNPGIFLCSVMLLCLGGCATVAPVPGWVTRGSGAYPGDQGRYFYGVGRASADIKDQSLRFETADNRARADIRRVFDSYTTYLMKDMPEQKEAGVERSLSTFSSGRVSGLLSGVQVTDRFTDEKGNVFTLILVDLETFKKNAVLMEGLSPETREYIRKQADGAFDRVSGSQEKGLNR